MFATALLVLPLGSSTNLCPLVISMTAAGMRENSYMSLSVALCVSSLSAK